MLAWGWAVYHGLASVSVLNVDMGIKMRAGFGMLFVPFRAINQNLAASEPLPDTIVREGKPKSFLHETSEQVKNLDLDNVGDNVCLCESVNPERSRRIEQP